MALEILFNIYKSFILKKFSYLCIDFCISYEEIQKKNIHFSQVSKIVTIRNNCTRRERIFLTVTRQNAL